MVSEQRPDVTPEPSEASGLLHALAEGGLVDHRDAADTVQNIVDPCAQIPVTSVAMPLTSARHLFEINIRSAIDTAQSSEDPWADLPANTAAVPNTLADRLRSYLHVMRTGMTLAFCALLVDSCLRIMVSQFQIDVFSPTSVTREGLRAIGGEHARRGGHWVIYDRRKIGTLVEIVLL